MTRRFQKPAIAAGALALAINVLVTEARTDQAKPTAPTAKRILAEAFDRARRENKLVFVDFGAKTWCVPCFKLRAFLEAPENAAILAKHFVVVELTVWENRDKAHLNNPGAEEQMKKWGLVGGIPFFVIADPSRRVLTTSISDVPLSGYPSNVKEIEALVAKLSQHAPRMSGDERGALRKWLLARSDGLGSIEGRVVRPDGQPVKDATVWLVRFAYTNGQRLPAPTGRKAISDASGRYLMSAVEPGEYRLLADAPTTGADVSAASFHPAATRVESAAVVGLDWGEDSQNRDITLVLSPPLRVSGRVSVSGGSGASAAAVTMTNVDWPAWAHRVTAAADGTFVVDRVRPGRYHVWTQSRLPGTTVPEVGYELVELSSARTAVAVRTMPGVTISGSVIFEGEPPAASTGTIRVVAVPVDLAPGAPAPLRQSTPSATGAFEIAGVFGGRIIRVDGLPPDWYVATVQLGNEDVTDRATEFAAAAALTVRMKRGGRIAGTVAAEIGPKPATGVALVFSIDPAQWGYRSRFVKTVPIERDGTFVVRGLPAGKYRVAAMPSLPQGWDAPESLKALEAGASTIDVREGERSEVVATMKGER